MANLIGTRSEPSTRSGGPAALRSRRRPQWILAGILCMTIGALGSVWLFSQLGTTQNVVQVTRAIHRGDVIAREDLTIVTIGSVPGVPITPAEGAEKIVGQTALIDLAGGTLLPVDAVGAPVIPAGKVQVGLRLIPGRIPSTNLDTGAKVMVVPVGAEDPNQASVVAEISGHPQSLDDGATLVNVQLGRADAEKVARWAAADNVALVREF